MPFEETLSIFTDPLEFGSVATWTPAAGGGPFTVNGIFDNAFLQTDAGLVGDATRRPVVRLADADIAGMKIGDALAIAHATGTVNYKVKPLHADGTGFTFVELAKQ